MRRIKYKSLLGSSDYVMQVGMKKRKERQQISENKEKNIEELPMKKRKLDDDLTVDVFEYSSESMPETEGFSPSIKPRSFYKSKSIQNTVAKDAKNTTLDTGSVSSEDNWISLNVSERNSPVKSSTLSNRVPLSPKVFQHGPAGKRTLQSRSCTRRTKRTRELSSTRTKSQVQKENKRTHSESTIGSYKINDSFLEENNRTPQLSKKFFKHKSPASADKLVGNIIVGKGFSLKFAPRKLSLLTKKPQIKGKKKIVKGSKQQKTSTKISKQVTKCSISYSEETNNTHFSSTDSPSSPKVDDDHCSPCSDLSSNIQELDKRNDIDCTEKSIILSGEPGLLDKCSNSYVTTETKAQATFVTSSPASVRSGPSVRAPWSPSIATRSFYSIFNKSTRSVDSSPRSSLSPQSSPGVYKRSGVLRTYRVSKEKDNKEQLILDAGQKRFGPIVCDVCGMIYTPSDPHDEATHAKFHQNLLIALKFPGWKKERIVQEYPDEASRVLMVLPADSKYAVKKIEEINKIMNEDLGYSVPSSVFSTDSKAFLYISDEKRVEGCCFAENVTEAYRVIPDQSSLHSDDTCRRPWCSETTPQPACVGISRIWVHHQCRRKGIASKLLDCVRKSFLYGEYVKKSEVAFSDPTTDGGMFAAKYTGTPTFLVYRYKSS